MSSDRLEREYMTTFAHHTCRENGRNTLAIDDSNDKLRCAECGRFCTLATDTDRGDGPVADGGQEIGQSADGTERLEEYVADLRHNSERRSDVNFDTDTAEQIAEELEALLETSEDEEKTPLEEWREHNESFQYDPPEKPADAWSSEEYEELYDRVISRRVEWFCDKCTGRGPFRSLEKARRHVESHHGGDLVEDYATPREEQETATDGGMSKSQVAERQEQNQSLSEFGPSSTDTDRTEGSE